MTEIKKGLRESITNDEEQRILRYLADNQDFIDVHKKDKSGMTLLGIAITVASPKVAEAVMKLGGNPSLPFWDDTWEIKDLDKYGLHIYNAGGGKHISATLTPFAMAMVRLSHGEDVEKMQAIIRKLLENKAETNGQFYVNWEFLNNNSLPSIRHGKTPPVAVTPLAYFALLSSDEHFNTSREFVKEMVTQYRIDLNIKTFKSYDADHPDESVHSQQATVSDEIHGAKYPIPNTYTYTAVGYASARHLPAQPDRSKFMERARFLLSMGSNPFVKMRPTESAKDDGRGGMRLLAFDALDISRALKDTAMVQLYETGYTVGGYNFIVFLRSVSV